MNPDACSIQEILRDASEILSKVGIADARSKARILLQHVLQCGPETIVANPDQRIDAVQQKTYMHLIERCCKHEPVTKIIGEREFWGLPFIVTVDTLDPRPDSETVIEAVLEHIPDRSQTLRVLDLGVGSGCLLAALLKEYPHAFGVGVDRSEAALAIAKKNLERHNLTERTSLVACDWLSAIEGSFDIIVSNPPYIPNDVIAGLEPEVKLYDPRVALAGGEDGLECYTQILEQLQAFNNKFSWLFLEIGEGQESAVVALLEAHGFEHRQSRHDLAGIARCIVASPPLTKTYNEKNV